MIYQHLGKHKHSLEYVKVQPLEVVQKQPGQSHKQFENLRKTSELNWIKKLQTAYPLGLNDNIMGKGNISRTSTIDILDIVDKRKRNNRSHGLRINRNKRAKHRTNFSLKDLLVILKTMVGINCCANWELYQSLSYMLFSKRAKIYLFIVHSTSYSFLLSQIVPSYR